MDSELTRELEKAETERGIMAKETEAEQTRFAREMLGGLGEEIKAWDGNPSRPIKNGLWCRIRMWAKRVMG